MRPDPDRDQVHGENDGQLVGRVENISAQGLDHPHQDARDESPLHAAEPPQGHDAETDQAEGSTHEGVDVVMGRQEGAGHPYQGRADAEGQRVDALGVDAHDDGRLPIHLHRQNGLAGPGVAQEPEDPDGGEDTSDRGDDFGDAEHEAGDVPGPGQQRVIDRAEVGGPDEGCEVRNENAEAEGHHQLGQSGPVHHLANDEPVDEHAEQEKGDGIDRYRKQGVDAAQHVEPIGEEHADHEEVAVREVEHVHDTPDQGEADG